MSNDNNDDGIYGVKIYNESAEGYWAFLTPEASKALDAYIRTRKLNGEHIDEDSLSFCNKTKCQNPERMIFLANNLSTKLLMVFTKKPE